MKGLTPPPAAQRGTNGRDRKRKLSLFQPNRNEKLEIVGATYLGEQLSGDDQGHVLIENGLDECLDMTRQNRTKAGI